MTPETTPTPDAAMTPEPLPPVPPNPAPPSPSAPKWATPGLIIGIAIICFGLVLMLENLGFEYGHYVLRLWPLVLVVLGVVKIRTCEGPCTGGYILVAAGALLLLKTLGGQSIGDLIGPGILVAVGIFIVQNALKRHRKVPPELQQSEGFVRGHAILSGFNHRMQTRSFSGGELTAIFGGFDVDLRQAAMEGSSARLDAFVMFGGGDLRLPEGWEVVVQATAIFGGVNDKTVPTPSGTEARPRLVVTGLVLFGGIEIRN